MRDDDRVEDLRDDLDRRAQRYERANERISPVSATDRTGTVTVRLDSSGVFASVIVTDNWRHELNAAGLADAVMESFGLAGAERARVWGETVAQVQSDPSPQTRPVPPLHTTLAGQLQEIADRDGAPPSEATVEALHAMIADIRTGMREVFGKVETRMHDRLSGTSSSGHVTATVTGSGALEALEFDERWLARAHAFNVSRECTEAITSGFAKVADPATLAEGTSLERVTRLTKDAEALAAFVRQHER